MTRLEEITQRVEWGDPNVSDSKYLIELGEQLQADLAQTKAYWEECQVEHNKRQREVHQLIEALGKLEFAAAAFEAAPPDDMKSGLPFNQYTTVEDCRLLNIELTQARAVLSIVRGNE